MGTLGPVAGSDDCRLWGKLTAEANLRWLGGLLYVKSLEYAVPQFSAKSIRLQAFSLVSPPKTKRHPFRFELLARL